DRLPDRHRLGVPRLGAGPRHRLPHDRRADRLRQDDGGERQSARAGVLPALRIADLLDVAGRGGAAVLHGARRHPAAAPRVPAEEAELVPLVAAVARREGRGPQGREAGLAVGGRGAAAARGPGGRRAGIAGRAAPAVRSYRFAQCCGSLNLTLDTKRSSRGAIVSRLIQPMRRIMVQSIWLKTAGVLLSWLTLGSAGTAQEIPITP